MSNLAAATVALVILIDLATGQGPPIYNAYREAMGPPVHGPPGPLGPHGHGPVPYLPRGEYDAKEYGHKYAKEFADEYAKDEGKFFGKDSSKDDKEFKHKDDKFKGYGDDKKEDGEKRGMFSSLSSSVSGAWNKWG